MTRINRPDTLLTELREIKRRLRLLEAAHMRPGAAAATAAVAPPSSPLSAGPAVTAPTPPAAVPLAVPLMPARSADWPGTSSPEWERLLVTSVALGGRAARISLHVVVDPGSQGAQPPLGSARVTVDGAQIGDVLPVTEVAEVTSEYAIAVTAGDESSVSEVAVEARLTQGSGAIRAAAVLLPG